MENPPISRLMHLIFKARNNSLLYAERHLVGYNKRLLNGRCPIYVVWIPSLNLCLHYLRGGSLYLSRKKPKKSFEITPFYLANKEFYSSLISLKLLAKKRKCKKINLCHCPSFLPSTTLQYRCNLDIGHYEEDINLSNMKCYRFRRYINHTFRFGWDCVSCNFNYTRHHEEFSEYICSSCSDQPNVRGMDFPI